MATPFAHVDDDPGSVRALLTTLRAQQDAQDKGAEAPPPRTRAAPPQPPPWLAHQSDDAYNPWTPALDAHRRDGNEPARHTRPAADELCAAPTTPPPRSMGFADALRVVAERAGDARFLAAVQELGVPTFYDTDDADALRAQARVAHVLDSLLEGA
ncbi:hypothetical protein MSPP1_004166 [Malassezia sp. CBS 17886]|nr:hypothetical protein MSPP1_004166 [Malassezia sp. CBS 17886]